MQPNEHPIKKKKKKSNCLPCYLRNAMLNIFRTIVEYDLKKSVHMALISQISHTKLKKKVVPGF